MKKKVKEIVTDNNKCYFSHNTCDYLECCKDGMFDQWGTAKHKCKCFPNCPKYKEILSMDYTSGFPDSTADERIAEESADFYKEEIMKTANTLEEAMRFFLNNCTGSITCKKDGEEKECFSYFEAKNFFEEG